MGRKPNIINKIASLTLILLFAWTSSIYCLPEVDEVVSGEAQIEYPDGNTMSITADDKTIINFSSFNVAENESVIITLPSVDSQILNRV